LRLLKIRNCVGGLISLSILHFCLMHREVLINIRLLVYLISTPVLSSFQFQFSIHRFFQRALLSVVFLWLFLTYLLSLHSDRLLSRLLLSMFRFVVSVAYFLLAACPTLLPLASLAELTLSYFLFSSAFQPVYFPLRH